MSPDLRAPFPYFGGKADASGAVWAALGDVENYVEPFAGSLAVLLRRPHEPRVETVNDADGLLCNAWRALRADPEGTAWSADWPVSELDLTARHLWLVEHREELTARLVADPEWFDARAAGWWIWGACCWIGSGWCSGKGAWARGEGGAVVRAGAGIDRKRPHLSNIGTGINKPSVARQIPHLENDGQGVNGRLISRRLPELHDDGRGVHKPAATGSLVAWFSRLSGRLRGVRVCCGDWSRVMGPSVTTGHLAVRGGGACGVFLDPPYGDVRTSDLYAADSLSVAAEVRAWCAEHAKDPGLRIVLAGFEGEGHEALGWREVEWYRSGYLSGGYAKQGAGTQQRRERLWLSPGCLEAGDGPLFAGGLRAVAGGGL